MAIPSELKVFNQWVVSNSIKKIPYGKDGLMAKVNDSSTWLSYDEAIEMKNDMTNNFNCVGFVLTRNDPYCVIDLDDAIPSPSLVQRQVLESCENTYTELSISNKGYHILMKGECEGRRKEKVELYSYSRYIIMTGESINNMPIINGQKIIDEIIVSMNLPEKNFIHLDLSDEKPDVVDEEITKRCSAQYGTKFDTLYAGDWKLHYQTQSEADLMFFAMLCQFTNSNSQVIRIFKSSGLGKREKANRPDYLSRSINKVRQNLLWNKVTSTTDVSLLYEYIMSELQRQDVIEAYIPELPEGIIKNLTQFIMDISVRPVYEISLVAALGFFAGLCGRAFNISNSGLNLYLLLLAPTGSGKEAISSGIDRVLNNLRPKIPVIDTFVGPKGFSSGQALFRHLEKQISMCCVFGEFGYMLQSIGDANVSTQGHMLMFRRALLDLYQKSGQFSVVKPTAYADFKNDVPAVQAPNFNIIGEGTPETFYSELSESMITDGLLPRFIVIEYTGGRPPRNKIADDFVMSEDLINSITYVAEIAVKNLASNQSIDVKMDEEAEALLDMFDSHCDDKINHSVEFIKQIWNRAHLKALKLSALLAISYDALDPIIRREHAEWSISFVENEITRLITKFDTGEFGDENKYTYIIKEILTKFMQMTPESKLRANIPYFIVHHPSIVTEVYLLQKMRSNKTLRKDFLNQQSLRIILEELVEQEILVKVDKEEARSRFKYNGTLYSVGRNFI